MSLVTVSIISSSRSESAPGSRAPPRKPRSSTWPSGARNGNLVETKLSAVVRSPSVAGTTMP